MWFVGKRIQIEIGIAIEIVERWDLDEKLVSYGLAIGYVGLVDKKGYSVEEDTALYVADQDDFDSDFDKNLSQ